MQATFPHFGTDDALFLLLIPLVIFVLILAHEMGHYIMARIFGMQIQAVQLGIGPKLWSRKNNEKTKWSIHLYPVSAYVQIEDFNQQDQKQSFRDKGFWKKILTILGGPLANLLFPFLLFLGLYTVYGQPVEPPVLTAIEIGHAADRAGLRHGDRVLAVNGTPVYRYKDIDRLSYQETPSTRSQHYTVQRESKGEFTEINLEVEPDWIEYTDLDGIARAHKRLGVIWRHKPFELDALRTINGEVVKGNRKKARELLVENLGGAVQLGFHSTDGNTRIYKVFLHPEPNKNLKNKTHADYTRFYTGAVKDNSYMRFSMVENLYDSFDLIAELIGKIAHIPFQLLPIDPELKDGLIRIDNPETWGMNIVYRCAYLAALFSIALGLINLIPLPRLDGSYMLYMVAEALSKKPLTNRRKAWLLSASFMLLYGAVLLSNLDNVPGYVDSRVKKVQKIIKNNQQE